MTVIRIVDTGEYAEVVGDTDIEIAHEDGDAYVIDDVIPAYRIRHFDGRTATIAVACTVTVT